jgi:hypothetical protein
VDSAGFLKSFFKISTRLFGQKCLWPLSAFCANDFLITRNLNVVKLAFVNKIRLRGNYLENHIKGAAGIYNDVFVVWTAGG